MKLKKLINSDATEEDERKVYLLLSLSERER